MATPITTITGLQNLPNLEEFNADWNSLVSVDFSNLTNLTIIDISDCETPDESGKSLTSVNVTGCTNLEQLRMGDSNFSAGFPNLNSCTSLVYFDADQCGISGSLNLSQIPVLGGFDLSGNSQLTELIVSSNQPLGDFGSIRVDGTSLTQTSLDNLIQAADSGSVNNGFINLLVNNSVAPSFERGLPALRGLDAKSWGIEVNPYDQPIQITNMYETAEEAAMALVINAESIERYIYTGTSLAVGNFVYVNNSLVSPVTNGFFASADGYVYDVDGGQGEIVNREQYGV